MEIIQQAREIEGVHGVHLMAYRQEELVAEIVEEAGLMSRRRIAEEPASKSWRAGRREAKRSDGAGAEVQPGSTK